MGSKQKYVFFIVLAVSVFILIFPEISSGGTITGPDCDNQPSVTYCTECNECFGIGRCGDDCCDGYYDSLGRFHCTRTCKKCSCETKSWSEYRCSPPGCGGDIQIRDCEVYTKNKGRCHMGSCVDEYCCVKCDPWELCQDCGSWQKPIRSPCECSKAGLKIPECKCKGECIDKPVNPRYFNDPTIDLDSPQNCHLLHADHLSCADQALKDALLEKIGRATMDKDNIFLPVKLDWDPVRGDINGWAEGNECKNCSDSCATCPGECYEKPECVKSYIIEIDSEIEKEMRDCDALERIAELEETIEETMSIHDKIQYESEIEKIRKEELRITEHNEALDKSEWTPPCSCIFKSNRTYNWRVRGCCPAYTSYEEYLNDGNREKKCGPWSDWQFKTNPAPEPKPSRTPYYMADPEWIGDPDWAGPGRVENLTKEEIEKLKWCEIDDPELYYQTTIVDKKYYRPLLYRLFIYYSGQDKCHPNLLRGEECGPEILDIGPLEYFRPFPPFEFQDRDHVFFTKVTPYAWKVAACKDISSTECSGFSQLWRFEAENFALDIPKRDNPPDDPLGEKEVGLPVLLRWSSPYGMSFNYDVNPDIDPGKSIDTNVVLDYPDLSLDTLYEWEVQPCWDYNTEECESFWGGLWYFKTTGRPPKELVYPENNASGVVTPVNFEWESVPGAKSYIFEINGEEKIVNQPEISLNYPDLLQETNYSWQVKTCVRDNGTVCGDYSNPQTFETFKLQPPVNPGPRDGSTISTTVTHLLSWNEIVGAKYYQFEIKYTEKASGEIRGECSEKEGKTTTKIISENSVYYPLECNGEYQWQVRGCLDEKCDGQSAGEWNDPSWTFALVSKKTTQEVLEETIKDVFINKVSPEIFENVPETAAKDISATAKEVSEKILELGTLQDIPGKIRAGLSGAADVSEISENLEGEFNTAWQEVVTEASTIPEVSPEVLETVLSVMEGELRIVLEDIKGQISDGMEMSEALDIVENNLNEAIAGIPERVKKKVSDGVLEATKDIPKNLSEGMLTKISEDILRVSELSEVPDMLENELNDEWQKESQKAVAKASVMPEVPMGVLETVLGDMKEGVLGTLLAMVVEEIPGIPGEVKIRKGGLVPCGRTSYNPDTPWREDEPCEFKHVFIMGKIIIDFLLTKIAPLFIVLLALATGLIFYFSLGGATVMSQVRSLWKAAGIGFGLLIFGWLLISWILTIFGYKVGVFGIYWPW